MHGVFAPPYRHVVATAHATDGWYLAECYRPQVPGPAALDETVAQLGVAAMAESTGVRLLLAVCAPTDELLISLFWAPSLESVVHVCERAGLPADRISAGVHARINADAANALLRACPPRSVPGDKPETDSPSPATASND